MDPASAGLGSRARYLWLALCRRVELLVPASSREGLRADRVIPRVLATTLIAVAVLTSIYHLQSHSGIDGSDNTSPNGRIVESIRSLNELIKRDPGGASSSNAGTRNHGDLSALVPADWSYTIPALRLSLDREPKDFRDAECRNKSYGNDLPSVSVVIIFCNEPFETLLRSVHSVLNTSPPELLEEVLLVDDGSDAQYIRPDGSGLLEAYLGLLPKVRLLRTGGRTGIVRARLMGIEACKSQAFVILDSHVEAQPGWLEPLLYPIGQDTTSVTMPHIDGLDKHSLELQKGGVGCTLGIIWSVMEHAIDPQPGVSPLDRLESSPTGYVTSPAMAGGLFAADKAWFLKLGGYDLGMTGWGAENVEFSFRLWQCGGKLLCTECSRVNHMFGGGKHYKTSGGSTSVNRMRTIASWMDEYADLAWHVLGKPPMDEIGDLTRMKQLRKDLGCKSFKWFLTEIYPESFVVNLDEDVPYLGPLRNAASLRCILNGYRGSSAIKTGDCSDVGNRGSQIFWRRPEYITVEFSDETCMVGSTDSQPGWNWCRTNRRWQVDLLAKQESASGDVVHTNTTSLKNNLRREQPVIDEKNLEQLLQEGRTHVLEDAGLTKVYSTLGDHVLVRLKSGGRCLTERDDQTVALESCDGTNRDQLWFWTTYKMSPQWQQHVKQMTN